MVRRESIEVLAVHFTAGVAAGSLLLRLPLSPYLLSLSLYLLLAVLMGVILRSEKAGLVFPAFLLCGVACALTDAFAGVQSPTFLQRWASEAGTGFRTFIDRTPFPSDGTGALLKALLTGDRSGLSRETIQVFRGSGAAHLLALSGLHMGILYLILSKTLRMLGNRPSARWFRYALTVGAAGFFTLMTGASPSLTRAFLFILLRETARLLGRPMDSVRILASALLVQLVLTPSALHSLGFQLSYLAMAGIFLLYPRLEALYPEGSRLNPFRRIWQAAALSLSCQAMTAPLVWFRFRTFPAYFLLTNLLAMPLTSLIMGSAVVTLALSGLGCCPGLLLRLTDVLCSGLLRILEIISTM